MAASFFQRWIGSWLFFLSIFFCPYASFAEDEQTISLTDALRLARQHQPLLQQSKALLHVAQAQRLEGLSALLPQVTGSASYTRSTSNFAGKPGSIPSALLNQSRKSSTQLYPYYSLGVTLTQVLVDVGQMFFTNNALISAVKVQKANQTAQLLQVMLNVRSAFYLVQASKALFGVAKENVANQRQHVLQIQTSLEAQLSAKVDLLQGLSSEATAESNLIQAESNYENAKLQLLQSIGWLDADGISIVDEPETAVDNEDQPWQRLWQEAEKKRPDLLYYQQQAEVLQYNEKALQSQFVPTLALNASFTDAGQRTALSAWNMSLGVALNWNILQGGLVLAQLQENKSQQALLQAQYRSAKMAAQAELLQALRSLKTAKSLQVANRKALKNAQAHFQLAQQRYEHHLGSSIDLSDAQLLYRQAQAQVIQADYQTAMARSQLLKALGRES